MWLDSQSRERTTDLDLHSMATKGDSIFDTLKDKWMMESGKGKPLTLTLLSQYSAHSTRPKGERPETPISVD